MAVVQLKYGSYRLHCLVTGYMTKEFSIKTRNYQNELNMIIVQYSNNIFIELANKTLITMIKTNNVQILNDSNWVFNYLSNIILKNDEQQIQQIINNKSLDQLIQLLDHTVSHIRYNALKTIAKYDTIIEDHTLISNHVNRRYLTLPEFAETIHSDSSPVQYTSIQNIRRLLSIERDATQIIQFVIDSGIVSRLIEFLQFDKFPRLQFEAAWCLTNISSGNSQQCDVVIEHGAIPIFVKLLASDSYEIKEQTIWALGNISGDKTENRDLILSYDTLSYLLPMCHTNIQTQQQVTFLRTLTWALSNFCRGTPCVDWKYGALLMKALEVMITSDDDEILKDACGGFEYLSNVYAPQCLDAIVKCAYISERLIELLDHSARMVRHGSLRAFGNIVSNVIQHDEHKMDINIIDNYLKKLRHLMIEPNVIKRDACWAISNITAGNKQQIEQVLSTGLIYDLINIMKTGKFEVSKEALWAICNVLSGGTDVQIKYLVNQGVIQPLCRFFNPLMVKSNKCLLIALEGVEYILAVGSRLNVNDNVYVKYVEEADGVDYLERIISNVTISDNVYDKAVEIMKTYWN